MFTSATLALSVHPSLPLDAATDEYGEVTLHPEQQLTIAVSGVSGEPLVHVPPELAWQLLLDDMARWRAWADQIPGDLPVAAAAHRSAIGLGALSP